MSKYHWSNTRQRLGNRAAVVLAGTIGFAVGGVTLAGALGADDPAPTATDVSISVADTAAVDSTVVDSSVVDSSVVDTSVVDSTIVDSTVVDSTVVDSSLPDSSLPDSSVPDNSVPNSTTPGSVPDSSTPGTTPGSSVPTNNLPAPFTKTYDSTGGSITVTWNGTSFTLDSINATAGYDVEIKDQRWDRIRVEFDNGDDDSRIEVRLSDDDHSIRVRID
jgi:hypothetical protein